MAYAIIDEQGYRLGVGMVIINAKQQVFWACRSDREQAWQFPQGGIHLHETPQEAMLRELQEEVGLCPQHIEIIKESDQWYCYQLPAGVRQIEGQTVVGQKQRWFLVKMLVDDHIINLNYAPTPEFNQWCWVTYEYPLAHIVSFKAEVYRQVLKEFAELGYQ